MSTPGSVLVSANGNVVKRHILRQFVEPVLNDLLGAHGPTPRLRLRRFKAPFQTPIEQLPALASPSERRPTSYALLIST